VINTAICKGLIDLYYYLC